MGRVSNKLQRLENALNRGDREDTEGGRQGRQCWHGWQQVLKADSGQPNLEYFPKIADTVANMINSFYTPWNSSTILPIPLLTTLSILCIYWPPAPLALSHCLKLPYWHPSSARIASVSPSARVTPVKFQKGILLSEWVKNGILYWGK